MSKDLDDLDDLEGLDELDELDDLESAELEELPAGELPPLPPAGAPPAAAPAAAAPARAGPREVEQAPPMRGKAAVILTAAALLPWLVPSTAGFPLDRTLAKLVILLGGYLMYVGVKHQHGEAVPGFLAQLGGLHKQALFGLGVLAMLLGAAPLVDAGGMQAIIEEAAEGVGALVWCQVQAYAKGGKFNPVAGLLIPMFGLGGLGRLVTIVKQFDLLALVGSLGVTAAGGVAGYTLFVAMKEAKEHGKAKKAAALEARKRERVGKRPR
jgi:hypothetical protein